MASAPVTLVLPGEPAILGYLEAESAPSTYSGRPLRRLELTLEVRGDDSQERLTAELGGSGGGPALISDGAGGQWKVTSYDYSYQEGQGTTTYTHDVQLIEVEQLALDRVEFDGMTITPERWSLDQDAQPGVLIMMVSLDGEHSEQFERVLAHRRNTDGEDAYFPVRWIGVSDEPISMRFGQCLWEPLDDGSVRHKIVLITRKGDDDHDGFFDRLYQPERARLVEQSVVMATKLNAFLEELQRAGVLDGEAVGRINSSSQPAAAPDSTWREFERARNVEDYFD
jgi:hypothetical protein